MNWIGRFFEKRKVDLDEEITAHIEMDAADRVDQGQAPDEARAAVRRESGNVALVQDVTHSVWGWGRLENFVTNLRYALRGLIRTPGFSIFVIMTLAAGVGSTCAMFTVVDRILFRRLPFYDPDQLVSVYEAGKRGIDVHGSPYLDIVRWMERSHAVSEIAYYTSNNDRVAFLEANAGGDMQVNCVAVGANLFSMLGARPVQGRDFLALDEFQSVKSEDEHSLVLSNAVWKANYGADPGIVGKIVRLNGDRFTIIGIMPPVFTFPFEARSGGALPVVWRPIVLHEIDASRNRQTPHYNVLARLKEGTTLAAATAELKAIQPAVAAEYTNDLEREQVTSIDIQRYGKSLVPADMRKGALALFASSALLWLIGCVNTASLVLARASTREREFAIRIALGASHWQIAEQLLMEATLLSGIASVVGLGLAVGMLKFFTHSLQTQFSIRENLTPSPGVLGALLGLTILGALLISAWPLFGRARASLEAALRQGAPQQGITRKQHRVRVALIVTEIALSLTLLVGCGLLLRTIYALKHVALGFHTENIVVANMTIPSYKFAGRNMTTDLYQPLIERVKQMPETRSASLLTEVPLGKTFQMIFTLAPEGNSADDVRRREMKVQFRAVGPEMQQVFGFQMLRGRFFDQNDTATSQPAVIVNRAFVKAYYGDNRDPSAILGQTLISFRKDRPSVVVGVLDDERQVSVSVPSQPEIEICIPQITPESMFYKAAEGMAMDLAVRIDRNPSLVMPKLREVLSSASPELAASNFTTMDQVMEDSFGNQNLAAKLLEIFGGLALLLSLTGIYGLLAYSVVQRRRELGVRIALGAQKRNIMTLVLGQAGTMLLAGLGIGIVATTLTSKWLAVFLYGVKSNDLWTIGVVSLVLFLGGLIASSIPAWRAARVNPIEVVRAE